MAVADSAAFSLRPLVTEVVRKHGGAPDGRAVEAIVREVDGRVPAEMSRAVYLESLAAIVREVAVEERRKKWQVPPPVPSATPVARAVPVSGGGSAVSPVVVTGEVVAESEARTGGRHDPEPAVPEEGAGPDASGGGVIAEPREVARPASVGAFRCAVSDLPVYSCAHCRGDDVAGQDEEFRLGGALRDRIEAGMDRLQAVEEVLELLGPMEGVVRAAARAALLRVATKIERRFARETERAALARGEGVTSLERAAAAMRFGETPFKLPNGGKVTWEDATQAQHNARMAWMRGWSATAMEDAELHERAVRLLKETGARTLKEIPGWEERLGEIRAIEPGDVA